MTITRAQLRTRSLQLADAVSSPRWDATAAGEVDQHMGMVHAKEWRRILNANPYYRVAQRTVTLDSQGRILASALSDLSTPDTAQRFYRILTFSVSNVVLKEISAKDGFMSTQTTDASGVGYGFYFRQDVYFYAPGRPNETANIWVNHIPTRPDNLSNDGIAVEFIDDYEDIMAYELASVLLSKGAAESDATASCKALAEDLRRDMLQDLTRTSINPLVLGFPDTSREWGGG